MIRAQLRSCVVMLLSALLSGPLQAAEEEVRQLLAEAEQAYASKHFIYPASGSAMTLYYDVLALEPDNAAAIRGLETLVEHFLEQAAQATERQQYISAQIMVDKARMVDPTNPNIEPIALELRLLENADRQKTTLDWRQVADRSSALTPILRKLGTKARKPGCRAIISVSSDAEGRWVYQQMSQAPGDRRIQAQVRIESPAAVEVLCLVTDNDSDPAATATQ